jgi:hypothetical protein
MTENTPHWGIVYHTNSSSPRAKKWYHVARVIKVDGRWFELYWYESEDFEKATRSNNLQNVRLACKVLGFCPERFAMRQHLGRVAN